MTFAPTPSQTIGTIEAVLAADDFNRDDYKNDGAHTYIYSQEETKSQLPITDENIIRMPLSSANCHVVQFDKSFITLKVEATIPITGYTASNDNSGNSLQAAMRNALDVFVGFKHSTDAIGRYNIKHKNRVVAGMSQDHGTLESFLYHSYRSQDDLTNRRGIHTIAESAFKDDLNSVCGEYITLQECLDAHASTTAKDKITKTFSLIIPFNDILMFQQFRDYPSELFGSLDIEFVFNPKAFVYKQCERNACFQASIIRHNMSDSGTLIDLYNNKWQNSIDVEYAQIGDSIKGYVNATYASSKATYNIGSLTFGIPTIKIVEAHSTICGYNINPNKLEDLREKYKTQLWTKFTQTVSAQEFSSSFKPGVGFVSQLAAFDNTTDMVVLFPTTTNESFGTVYKNPMMEGLILSVMGRKYPDMPLDTTTPRFAAMMLNASDTLHAAPLKEYVDSLSIYRYDDGGKIYPTCDLTTFFMTLKCERPSAMGMIMDGIDSRGRQVAVRLSGQIKDSSKDEYQTKNPPPPILALVNDAVIAFSTANGGMIKFSTEPIWNDYPTSPDDD